MLAINSRLREKNITFKQKKSNSKPVKSVFKDQIAQDLKFFEKFKSAKAPTNNNQIEWFVVTAKFYGRMITDFATEMLPLSDLKNSNFSRRKMQQKVFGNINKLIM